MPVITFTCQILAIKIGFTTAAVGLVFYIFATILLSIH